MRPEDQQRMEELCAKIAVENDPHKFLDLVKRLNDLLEHSQQQLDAGSPTPVKRKAP